MSEFTGTVPHSSAADAETPTAKSGRLAGMRAALDRIGAVFIKELVQMRRDRLTFGMMLMIPIMQLILFGYAINTDPKHLPTAVVAQEHTPTVRRILSTLENSQYYDIVLRTEDVRKTQEQLKRGEVTFVVVVPAGFTADLMAGRRPQILIEADASDPVAASGAISHARTLVERAVASELRGPLAPLAPRPGPVEVIVHPNYNPEGITQYNIVPGLLGVILTMTMVMITAMAMTRETERGTMENLLAMPATPFEVMVGKITPYVFVGLLQTGIILTAAAWLFGVPFVGGVLALSLGVALFLIANLAVGFTFSTIAKSQMQAMQLTFFFFLPSLLLSGFMFPFQGMPGWAQAIGEGLPLTHFLRIVRGVMLKGADTGDISVELAAMTAFALAAGAIAMIRYRRTLD